MRSAQVSWSSLLNHFEDSEPIYKLGHSARLGGDHHNKTTSVVHSRLEVIDS